jgi:hypothetical protein
LNIGRSVVNVGGVSFSRIASHFSEEFLMPTYNGIEVTEEFYAFFAPYFVNLISHISDPREQDNVNLQYTLPSYLSAIILGISQGATTMRQIALFSQDEAVRQHLAFLCDDGETPRAQNSFTNLTEQLNPQEFQQQYTLALRELYDVGAFAPFLVDGLRVGAIDGIELHHHLYTDLQNVTPCDHCLTRIHKKGTEHEREECFHRHVIFSLVGAAGSVFFDQEPMYPSEDGHDKGSEKKAAKRLLTRMSDTHLLDMIDVVVCDALYADADFIRTVMSYDLIPIIRIKQKKYNIMKEVNDLGAHLSFSQAEYDDERKRQYQYRVFEHLTSWQAYPDELCIVEIHEQLADGTTQQARWVFPQIHASQLVPAIVREIGHLRWQEEINEFKLANQHFDIKHMLHHEQNSIQIFLFLKLFVSTFLSLFLSQKEPSLQKKSGLPKI